MINTKETAFPGNLFRDIGVETTVEDSLPTLVYCMYEQCGERNAEITLFRYREGISLEQVGNIFGITRQRAQAIVADVVGKMSKPNCKEMIERGLKAHQDNLLTTRINEAVENVASRATLDDINDSYCKGYEAGYADGVEQREKNTVDMDYLKTIKLDSLDLSTHAYNSLTKNRVKTVADMLARGDYLVKERGVGVSVINEIFPLLRELGVSLTKYFPATMQKKGVVCL